MQALHVAVVQLAQKKSALLDGVRFFVVAGICLTFPAQAKLQPAYLPLVAFNLLPPPLTSIVLPLTRPVYCVLPALKEI